MTTYSFYEIANGVYKRVSCKLAMRDCDHKTVVCDFETSNGDFETVSCNFATGNFDFVVVSCNNEMIDYEDEMNGCFPGKSSPSRNSSRLEQKSHLE